MSSKKDLISELKNELRGASFYSNNKISYLGRTTEEAEELLRKLEDGLYDYIIPATYVRLDTLSKWDLQRNSQIKPELKDFRVFSFIEKMNEKISQLKITDLINKHSLKTRYAKFLRNIKSGVYDKLLNEEDFWFWKPMNFKSFIAWDEARCNTNSEVSLANYIVYSVYYEIMDHVKTVNSYKKKYGQNYKTFSSYKEQAPTTQKELEELENLAKKIVSENYNWREARNIVREYSKLNIYEDGNFPHNVEEIINSFSHDEKIVYNEFENAECCHDIEKIVLRAKEIYDLLPEEFIDLFVNPKNDVIDNYLRNMIVSQLDCKLLSEISDNKYDEDEIRSMLTNPIDYSKEDIKCLIFSCILNDKSNFNTICNIAKGTLYSLFNYQNSGIINILDEAKNLQEELGCSKGTVYYNDFNSVRLPNGETIYSTGYEDIPRQYHNFQKEYEFYSKTSSNDLEYIEGCTEIIGNVVISQIFREGNKRTSKCLFNALLISRGLVPPIIDFSKNKSKLFIDFVYNRKNKYMPVKREILESTIKMKEILQLKEDVPTDNSPKKL